MNGSLKWHVLFCSPSHPICVGTIAGFISYVSYECKTPLFNSDTPELYSLHFLLTELFLYGGNFNEKNDKFSHMFENPVHSHSPVLNMNKSNSGKTAENTTSILHRFIHLQCTVLVSSARA